jgi:plasmid maintenance system antidote protein VapI
MFRYKPKDASPPGDTLEDTMDALGMTRSELQRITSLGSDTLDGIFTGETAITTEIADQLKKATGIPVSFWLYREQAYRERLDMLS